jgi:hypothetical protein
LGVVGRWVRNVGLAGWIGAAGCGVHRVGWVESAVGPTVLVGADGRREKLMLVGSAAPVRGLDGYLVVVDGRKAVGSIQVQRWRALEGPAGYPVWAGPVQRLGVQIGIQDYASGVLVFVDEASADAMADHVGEIVAAEGYVDGPQRVTVLSWRPLE